MPQATKWSPQLLTTNHEYGLPACRVTRTSVLSAIQLLCSSIYQEKWCSSVGWVPSTETSLKGCFWLVFGLSAIAFTETHHAR
jgi:hypothetical protein